MAVQSRLVQNVRDVCTVSKKAARQGRFFRFQGCSSLPYITAPFSTWSARVYAPLRMARDHLLSRLAKMETLRKRKMQQCAGTEAVTEGIESPDELGLGR